MNFRRWLAPAFLLLMVLGILLPLSPWFRSVPGDDPSVYLYVGQRVLEGAAPYRDAWDHKQPLAFFLFAFGLLIGDHSLWGLWFIELAGLSAAALMGLWLAERIAPRTIAVCAVAAALLTLVIVIWGYSLEELSLVLQLGILYAFARLLTAQTRLDGWRASLWIGALTGVCFFLKQSLIAAGVAVGLALVLRLLIRRERDNLRWLAGMAVGGAVVGGLVLAYLFAANALGDYRDAAFTFNLIYANLGPLERVKALLDAVRFMLSVPGLLLALGLWAVCGLVAFRQTGPDLVQWVCSRRFTRVATITGASLVALSLAAELRGSEPKLHL